MAQFAQITTSVSLFASYDTKLEHQQHQHTAMAANFKEFLNVQEEVC